MKLAHLFIASAIACTASVFPAAPLQAEGVEPAKEKPYGGKVDTQCMIFNSINKNEVNGWIRDLGKTGFSEDDYLLSANCTPMKRGGGVKITIAQLGVEAPCEQGDFLSTIKRWYEVRRKQPEMFAEILNYKSTEGDTFLDYIETLGNDSFPSVNSKLCRSKLIELACSAGGVYSRHDKKCSDEPAISPDDLNKGCEEFKSRGVDHPPFGLCAGISEPTQGGAEQEAVESNDKKQTMTERLEQGGVDPSKLSPFMKNYLGITK